MLTRLPEDRQPGRRLGRHINHDPRSRQYRVARAADPTLASVMHPLQVPTLDQGNLGSCVLNTAVENLSAPGIWETLTPEEQAELGEPLAVDLYRETTAADPYPGQWEPNDTGTDALSAAKVLRRRGYISGWLHAFSPVTALQQLQKTTVQTGITWKTGCDDPDRDHIIRWTGAARGGHEVLAVGYDAARRLVRIRNHWGPGWGDGGECWMPDTDWMAALQDDGDALVLVPRTAPAPTPAVAPDLAALAQVLNPWAASPHRWAAATKAGRAWRDYQTNHHL